MINFNLKERSKKIIRKRKFCKKVKKRIIWRKLTIKEL